jgi:hypothetical protein
VTPYNLVHVSEQCVWYLHVGGYTSICLSAKLHRVTFHNTLNLERKLYFWRMRWARHVARGGEEQHYRLSDGRKPLGGLRRRWVDNIKVDLG